MSTILRSLKLMVGADFTQAQKGFALAAKDLKKAGQNLTNIGNSLTKGVTIPIMAAVAGIGALVVKTTAAADAISTMAGVTGLSSERLQELQYASSKLDVELEMITNSQSKLIKAMSAAQAGTKEQSNAFKALGVAVVDGNGNLRDSNVVFGEVITALGNMKNPTERDAIALKILGRSAMELNPLIKAGAGELARLSAEAYKMGAVIDNESILAMDKFNDSLAAAKIVLAATASKITVALLPTLQQLLPVIQNNVVPAIKAFAGWMSTMLSTFKSMSPFMQGLTLSLLGIAVAAGPVLSGIGRITTGISGLIKMLGTALTATTTLTGAMLTMAGVAGVVAAGVGIILSIYNSEKQANKYTTGIGAAVVATGKFASNATKTTEELNNQAKSLNKVTKAAEGGTLAFDKLNILQESLADSDAPGILAPEPPKWEPVKMPGPENLLNIDWNDFWGWFKTRLKKGWDVVWLSLGIPEMTWSNLTKRWNALWDGVGKRIGALKEDIRTVAGNIKDWFAETWEKIRKGVGGVILAWNGFWDNAKKGIADFKTGWDTFRTGVGTIISNVKADWNEFWEAVKTGVGNLKKTWDGFWSGVSNIADNLKKGWEDAIKGIKTGLINLYNSLPDWWFTLTGTKRIEVQEYGFSTKNSANAMQMRQFSTGTPYVPYTGPAIIHEGEAVIPKESNPFAGGLLSGIEAGVYKAVKAAMGQSGNQSIVVQVGGKTVLDTVITEAQRKNSRSGRSVVTVRA